MNQDVQPSRHHDTRTFEASLGKAPIGTLGSRHCDTCTDEVSPGKAQTTLQEAVTTMHPSQNARQNASTRQPMTNRESGRAT